MTDRLIVRVLVEVWFEERAGQSIGTTKKLCDAFGRMVQVLVAGFS